MGQIGLQMYFAINPEKASRAAHNRGQAVEVGAQAKQNEMQNAATLVKPLSREDLLELQSVMREQLGEKLPSFLKSEAVGV